MASLSCSQSSRLVKFSNFIFKFIPIMLLQLASLIKIIRKINHRPYNLFRCIEVIRRAFKKKKLEDSEIRWIKHNVFTIYQKNNNTKFETVESFGIWIDLKFPSVGKFVVEFPSSLLGPITELKIVLFLLCKGDKKILLFFLLLTFLLFSSN